MGDPDKAVFISYRRKLSPFVARSIFENLTNHGYDVFMDVESIDSGDFETVILHQIAARMHFLAILTPGALEPTSESGDWLRREVEHAIKLQRNVVPVTAQGFEFSKEAEKFPQKRFPGKVEQLRGFNGIDVPHDYFDEAMRKLRERFLRKPRTIAVTPAPQTELADVGRKIGKAIDFIPSKSTLNAFGLKASPFSKIPWFTLDAPTLKVQTNDSTLSTSKLKPMLSSLPNTLQWTPVPGATCYVLVNSSDSSFSSASELYRGDKTEFVALFIYGGLNFRVKAENDVLNLESPWSNVVTLAQTVSPFRHLQLQAPELSLSKLPPLKITALGDFSFETKTIVWTSVPGAAVYVLQSSNTELFPEPHEAYRGDQTFYAEPWKFLAPYYRVKAIGYLRSVTSPWSNILKAS